MYAKLINGILVVAPKRVIIDDTQVFNPTPEQLESIGYKQVVLDTNEYEDFEVTYEERDGKIYQKKVPITV